MYVMIGNRKCFGKSKFTFGTWQQICAITFETRLQICLLGNNIHNRFIYIYHRCPKISLNLYSCLFKHLRKLAAESVEQKGFPYCNLHKFVATNFIFYVRSLVFVVRGPGPRKYFR